MSYKIARYGWLPDLPDQRDHFYAAPVELAGVLPAKVDLRPQCPPVYDQGQLGSCFTGNTKVPLLNGRVRTLKELSDKAEGETFWVYSTTPEGRMVAGKARAVQTRKSQRLYKVVIDNGEIIECTADHLFMLRSGEYRKALDLKPGDSLMPFRRIFSEKGCELVFSNNDCNFHYTHWLVASSCFPEESLLYFNRNGIPHPKTIHHDNFNRLDNSPINLKPMTWSEHCQIHAALGKESALVTQWNGSEKQREHSRKIASQMHKEMPGWNLEGASKGGKKAWENANKDSAKKDRMLAGFEKGRTDPRVRARAIATLTVNARQPENRIAAGLRSKSTMAELRAAKGEAWENIRAAGKRIGGRQSLRFQIAKFGKSVLDAGLSVKKSDWEMYRLKHGAKNARPYSRIRNGKQHMTRSFNLPRYSTALREFETETNLALACANYNHKVVSVSDAGRREDVYCLQVEQHENFALEAGVYVHNCTANAIAAAIEFDRRKQKLAGFTPSRLFIYYNERAIEHTIDSDSGAQIRDGIKSVGQQGDCPETEWPYVIARFKTRPKPQCYADALKYRAVLYQRLTPILSQLKGCLASGYPFVFGFTVYESFESAQVARTGHASLPKSGERAIGGHAVAGVGYDDARQWFVVRNSWGGKWGMKGYFTLPYAYVTDDNLASDFWTIRIVQ